MASAVHLTSAVALAGRFPALSGVDLSVDHGEVVAVVGPNGAGKTSLLRLCAGLLPLSSGQGSVLGHDLVEDPAGVRRGVGFLGHAPALYDELTATENVRFVLRAAGLPVSRGAGALERLGIGGRIARTPVGRLSAGQRRRVALAALVAKCPALWLLDEPHAAMDPAGRELVAALIAEASVQGVAVILTSHELALARSLADRVVSMAGGRVSRIFEGQRSAPDDCRDDPGALGAPASGVAARPTPVPTLAGGAHVA